MTDRLDILERERERLEQVLADDPHWRAFCEAQERGPSAGRLHVLSAETVAGLTKSEPFAAYIKVVKAIDRLRASGAEQTFRTRLNVKPSPDQAPPSDGSRVDDLTAIRRIDRQLERRLNELGVFSFKTIAEWNRYDVRRVRDALDLGKRIWRENWIEQAAMLQHREPIALRTVMVEPEPAKALPEPEPIKLVAIDTEPAPPEQTVVPAKPAELDALFEPASAEPAPEPIAPAVPEASQRPTPAVPPRKTIKVGRRQRRLPAPAARRFVYLSGVSDEMADAMRSAGVKSLADIAAWSRADVKWFRAILGEHAQISGDQWIEQAALLSRGVWTRHALRVVTGETRLLVDPPEPVLVHQPALADTEPEREEAHAVVGASVSGPEVAPSPDASVPAGADTGNIRPEAGRSAEADAARQQSAFTASMTASISTEPAVFALDDLVAEGASTTTSQAAKPVDRFNPLRGLTTRIALGKIKRPPPDLGTRARNEEPSHAATPEPPVMPVVPVVAEISPTNEEGQVRPTVHIVPEEPSVECEVAEFAVADDWDDAEALVIKRPAPDDDLEDDTSTDAGPAVAAQPSPAEPPRSADPIDRAPIEFDETDDDADFGDEAEVVIVSRPRGAGASATPPQVTRGSEAGGKPDFLARRSMRRSREFGDDDDYGAPAIGFSEAAEEATVTIIRAEASEETAASIVRDDVANDADAPEQTPEKPRVSGLGSRFLRALTGD